MISTDTRPRVRPRLAKGSAIAFVLLLPFVAYSIWDYVETRRLRTRLDAIVARGEPTTVTLFRRLRGPAAESERFYRAASALTLDYTADIAPQIQYQVTMADRSGQFSAELIDIMRAVVRDHEEALALADRAAALPFEGFRGTSPAYAITGGLMGVTRLCELRARLRALEGDGDAAVDSMVSAVRLMRAIDVFTVRFPVVGFVLARTHPSAAARSRLETALADVDRGDRLKERFVENRAIYIDLYERDHSTWVARPLVIRQLNRTLDASAALIDAATRPASERTAAVMAVGVWPGMFEPANRSRELLESIVKGEQRQADAIRCARRLVAGEAVECKF